MKSYLTKSKMFGYQIGLLNDSLYVAVPEKYLVAGPVEVVCDGEKKIFTLDDAKTKITHDDKFNKGMTYTLIYLLWKEFPKD